MIRRLFKLVVALLILALLVAAGYAVTRHPGYVLISYQNFRYESTLWVFLGLLLALSLVLWLLRRLLRFLLFSGRALNPWSAFHRRRRADKAAERGLLELAEDRWQNALGHLKRAADGSAHPLPLLLGAARAANELGHSQERDALLEAALQRQPGAELAIDLERAELLESAEDLEGALGTLQALHQRYPQHPRIVLRLTRLLQRLHRWPELFQLLPALRRHRAQGSKELVDLQRQAWSGYLRDLQDDPPGPGDTSEALARIWDQLPSLHEEPEMILLYAQALHRLKADEQAEAVLRKAARSHYQPALAELYGSLATSDPGRQLKEAERWLPEHPKDAVLLRCLGRLSGNCSLWGKARDYLQSSLNFARRPETCADLARLLARLGDVQASQRLFLESLQLSDPQSWPSTASVDA